MKKILATTVLSFSMVMIISSLLCPSASGAHDVTVNQLKTLDNDISSLDEKTKNLVLSMRDNIKNIVKKDKNKEQIFCLAKNIYHESRNQPYIGQLAVAQVTLNRSKDDKMKPCKVVYRRNVNGCQFSWTCDNMQDRENEKIAWKESLALAYATYNNMLADPTNGATYYYNPKLAHPVWARKFQVVALIGDHKFLKVAVVEQVAYNAH
jgi:spore germination cell wall hydrolase CwlJ-like protein